MHWPLACDNKRTGRLTNREGDLLQEVFTAVMAKSAFSTGGISDGGCACGGRTEARMDRCAAARGGAEYRQRGYAELPAARFETVRSVNARSAGGTGNDQFDAPARTGGIGVVQAGGADGAGAGRQRSGCGGATDQGSAGRNEFGTGWQSVEEL